MEMTQTNGAISSERATFIMKVYGLLTLAIISCIAGGVTGAHMFTANSAAVPMLNILGFVALIVAMLFRKVRGLNLALLFGFTFLDGMMGGPYLHLLNTHGYAPVVNAAAGTTFGTFSALTAYVFWSRTDFSYLKGFLWAGLWGLLIVGFFGWFFHMSESMSLLYCYAGVLIFIGYVLYDTSNLIRNVPTDEYVHATLQLFLDIINLFWFILRIFMSRSRD